MELEAVKISMEATKLTFPKPADVQYYLLIILEGQNVSELELQSENIYEIISNFGAFEVYTPSNSDMANEWWKIRRSMGTAVKQISVYKEEDTVVPRGNLPQLLSGVKEIGQKYNFRSVCYGHAGDGNLHINILKDNLSQQQWTEEIPIAIREIFELCKSLGGTISGEHGIGLVQKPYLDIVISPEVMSIFQGIKNSFDPNRILNMGKWIG
jgi:glycolate oxidase